MSSSSNKPKRKRTALAQLDSHLKGPKDELQGLLYPTEGSVDYDKLRKLLMTAGEKEPAKLSKSQVTRAIERCLGKQKKLTMNQVRKALGKPEQDDEEEEEEEEEEEAAAPKGKKAPAKKKAKTTPTNGGDRRASILGLFSNLLSPLGSLFSPGKKN